MRPRAAVTPRKVLLVEFNEITWRLADPLCVRGELPVLAESIRLGARGTPLANEEPPNLDPWIAWTTVHTGRPQEEHGVRFLEQPPETVRGPRLADLAADAGKSVGVFGTIMSWPPRRDVRGFWVPSTFAPGPETFPEELRPLQELNLSQTRAHSPVAGRPRASAASLLLRLLRLGLRPSTIAELASFLVRSRLRPHRAWEKVSLQPLINLDVFEAAYRRHRPDFATFHTNHVAHYMHRYWRAFDPSSFRAKPSPEESRRYGEAIPFGYRSADRLLGRLVRLAGPDTVVVLASGLGQRPYDAPEYGEGRKVVRIRDIGMILDLCDLRGHAEAISMMAPQWNLRVPDPARRSRAEAVLRGAWAGDPDTKLFAVEVVGDTINFNVSQKIQARLGPDSPCEFPEVGGRRFAFHQLCATQDATPKEGYHDRPGMLVMRGPGIRPGALIGECTDLDLAPTILHILGLPVPSYMRGRVLEEAFEKTPTRASEPTAAMTSPA